MSKYNLGTSILGKRKLQQFRAGSGDSEGLFVTPDPQDDVLAHDYSRGRRGDYPTPGLDQATNESANNAEASLHEMDDDGNEHDAGYSDLHEQLPPHPAFSSNVKSLEQEALKTVLGLQDILDDHAGDSKNLQNMVQSAKSAVEQSAGPKKILGFLGDTGTGKSSTINSLTSISGLAVAVAAGESCTKVIMLFTHQLPFQTTAFAAEIRYSDLETCRKLLREQLKNYFRYVYEYDEEWDDIQQKEYESACQTAFKIFRSLFCDKPEFESPRAGKEFLEKAYRRNVNTALASMEAWCKSLLVDMMTEDGAVLRFEADHVDDLNRELSPHISEHHDFNAPTLCHLINRVTIGARDSRILKYVTLADLPGTSDVDQVRAAIAHEFLQKCDALLVFEPMARCVDHPRAERNIATNAERFGTNMALVVTRSDDNVDNTLAQSMQTKGQSIGDYFFMGAQIKQFDGQLMHLKREMEKKRQFETLVDARNTYTTRLLQHNKQRFMPSNMQLMVHCVSNTHYITHLLDPEPEGTLLDVNATGIPALRAWVLGIVAPSLLLAIEERMGRCCALVHGVAMWAQSTPQKRKAGILDVARAPGLSWPGFAETTLRSTETTADTSLFSPLQDKLDATVEAALGYHNTLQSTWHPSTLRAFFLKRGKHSTKRQALPTCWNEKLLEFQTKEVLNPNWSKMKEGVHKDLAGMVSELIDELNDIPKQLGEIQFMMAAQMENVKGIIIQYIGRIQRALALRLETYDKELGNIKQNASFDVPRAYFTQAMRPMYEVCSNMRGPGCIKGMMDEMADHLSGINRHSDPFSAVNVSLRSNLSRASNFAVRNLQSDVTDILRQLVQRFDAALAVENETIDEFIARQNILPALTTALADMERIDATLKTLKASKRDSKI
ncbi:hypothetical protein KC365_g15275 [Hortaea werneckii]|nr:hypothetical protein KC342_g16767 [Hortaea werneckii]KAI7059729.1 hypothetical protein KC339_g17306 [Hortaea werneckii]KAI7210524.1 hypothetical protein KC365_g15275 [Hortaea werneckii]